jgi:hypothetical protein
MISIVVLLYLYFGILAICLFFGAFNIYALFRFGASSVATTVTLLFFAAVAIILALTIVNIQQIDWTTHIDVIPTLSQTTL